MLHIATSRPVGELCKQMAEDMGYELVEQDKAKVFISIMYDKLIPESYINTHRCFNFHPGLLPEYRGAGAFSWALINGEKTTGITLHEIEKDIDNGKVIHRVELPITQTDTAETLHDKSMLILLTMFRIWLPKLIDGDYEAEVQDETKARVYLRKDLQQARDLTRFVRAFTFEGKPGAYYYKNGKKIDL